MLTNRKSMMSFSLQDNRNSEAWDSGHYHRDNIVEEEDEDL